EFADRAVRALEHDVRLPFEFSHSRTLAGAAAIAAANATATTANITTGHRQRIHSLDSGAAPLSCMPFPPSPDTRHPGRAPPWHEHSTSWRNPADYRSRVTRLPNAEAGVLGPALRRLRVRRRPRRRRGPTSSCSRAALPSRDIRR